MDAAWVVLLSAFADRALAARKSICLGRVQNQSTPCTLHVKQNRNAIAAVKPDARDVAMVIERAGKRMTVRLAPGRIGVYLSDRVK